MDPPKAQDDPARPSSGRRTNEQARRRRHRVDPSALAQLLGAAVAAHQQGRLDEAREGYAAVLAENPRQPDALQLLGVLLHLRGERSAALSLLRRAVRVAPDHAPAHDNLARVLRETGKPEAALPHHRVALALDPSRPGPFANLASSFEALGRRDEALDALAQAIGRDPRDGRLHQHRGKLLVALDRYQEATAAFADAIENGAHQANLDLANLLVAINDADHARAVARRWAAAAPDDPVARHMIAAFSGEATPPRASDDYLRRVFDRFASSFDTKLDQLEYRAPALLGARIAARLPPARGDRDVVDLGCGTGLCGPFLRPHARRLVGIDLSANMLAQARQRDQYDELVDAELASYLEANPSTFDLAVAGDVFCYFGDLTGAVRLAFEALRPGGLLAFTVEAEDHAAAPYVLRHNGRYAHGETYVRQVLEVAGFVEIVIAREALRRERDDLVRGLVVDGLRP